MFGSLKCVYSFPFFGVYLEVEVFVAKMGLANSIENFLVLFTVWRIALLASAWLMELFLYACVM